MFTVPLVIFAMGIWKNDRHESYSLFCLVTFPFLNHSIWSFVAQVIERKPQLAGL